MPDTRNAKLSRLRAYCVFLETLEDTEQNRQLHADAVTEILALLDNDA